MPMFDTTQEALEMVQESLTATFANPDSKERASVFLSGPPGFGKTTAAEELLEFMRQFPHVTVIYSSTDRTAGLYDPETGAMYPHMERKLGSLHEKAQANAKKEAEACEGAILLVWDNTCIDNDAAKPCCQICKDVGVKEWHMVKFVYEPSPDFEEKFGNGVGVCQKIVKSSKLLKFQLELLLESWKDIPEMNVLLHRNLHKVPTRIVFRQAILCGIHKEGQKGVMRGIIGDTFTWKEVAVSMHT